MNLPDDTIVKELEQKIEYHFKNSELLLQAVTHSSYANENTIHRRKDYERIEFLGDAVLETVSSEFIFRANPNLPEGHMSRLRASLVCEQSLAYCAKELELGRYLFLGKGEEASGGREKDSIIADVMEAITGAIFLDSGMENAKKFVHRFILSDLEEKKLFYDAKTILQEMLQKNGPQSITYVLKEEKGPDHNKEYVVEVHIMGKRWGTGSGRNKKAAEQKAAYEAILRLKKENEK